MTAKHVTIGGFTICIFWFILCLFSFVEQHDSCGQDFEAMPKDIQEYVTKCQQRTTGTFCECVDKADFLQKSITTTPIDFPQGNF